MMNRWEILVRPIARLAVAAVLLVAFVGTGIFAQAVPVHASGKPPVQVAKTSLGKILVNVNGLTLYYWEKERPGRIKCTGACASAWPPALVRTGARVSHTMRGIKGTFGTIARPDGKVQITFNHRALYRYVGDKKPGDTLCQAIEGWYVIRANGQLTGPSGS
jgi:predicted lipoprotein with Yx(FWY)xxD motif